MTRVEGLPVSIQARLARHARATGMDPNLILARFALERLLYRLSQSVHGDRFVLKGALMMLVWLGETIRPTRDGDLLGFGDLSVRSLTDILTELCALAVETDGLEFQPASIRVAPIRPEDVYGGMRATLEARLGKARLRVQLDVGIGDVVTPDPVWLEYPSLLEFPRPRLRAYGPETAIAEKLHAMVVLGEANSRMRDYFDVLLLAERRRFDGDLLAEAVRATFRRRQTALPADLSVGLTETFADIEGKRAQWSAFLRRNRLDAAPADLASVVAGIARFAGPLLAAAARGRAFAGSWPPGGPWR